MRIFSGITLEPATRLHCIEITERLQRSAFQARYESLGRLHMTLAFLGNVDASCIETLKGISSGIAAQTPAFELTLDKLSAFPNERRPRIIYIGSRVPSRDFRALALALREAFGEHGFIFEDDAVAHVTIARVKGSSARPLPMFDVTPMTVAVEAIALFESIPENATTRYVVRHTASLQKGEGVP